MHTNWWEKLCFIVKRIALKPSQISGNKITTCYKDYTTFQRQFHHLIRWRKALLPAWYHQLLPTEYSHLYLSVSQWSKMIPIGSLIIEGGHFQYVCPFASGKTRKCFCLKFLKVVKKLVYNKSSPEEVHQLMQNPFTLNDYSTTK